MKRICEFVYWVMGALFFAFIGSASASGHKDDTHPLPNHMANGDYGISLSYSSITYHPVVSVDQTSPVVLRGRDLAGDYHMTKWVGFEAALYQGETSKRSDGQGNSQVAFSSRTDMEAISTFGVRGGLICGVKGASPWGTKGIGIDAYTVIGWFYEQTKIHKVGGKTVEEPVGGSIFTVGLGYRVPPFSVGYWLSWRGNQPRRFALGSSQEGLTIGYRF